VTIGGLAGDHRAAGGWVVALAVVVAGTGALVLEQRSA
jgi:hypothetical protein